MGRRNRRWPDSKQAEPSGNFATCPRFGYASRMVDATDQHLASQYELYPYPHRDPRDEAKRLVLGSPGHLREVDHWVFGGRRPAARPLHALIAGGGTGDATIMLAQQMAAAGRAGTVTWLDRSAAALKVAQARAAARKLDNIVWCQASIADLPSLGVGPFDYVDCCGVLHHLPDPAEGLRALASVLAPGGGMGLMVYAPHGRTGVYMVQDALRRLAPADEAPQRRLEVAKRVLRHLPETQWLRQNRNFTDHLSGGDAGIYDLLLNPRDRAYHVAELAELVDSAGLRVRCWVEPMRYDPAILLPDPTLRARVAALDGTERAALAEALAGNMAVHVVYCTRADETYQQADPADPAAVPVFRDVSGTDLARGIRPDGTLSVVFDALRLPVALPRLASALLPLIDGQRTVAAIRQAMSERGVAEAAFDKAWAETFAKLEAINHLLLGPPSDGVNDRRVTSMGPKP
jgi:SAM-dependent methyltransferase